MPTADLNALKRRPLAPFCLQHLGYKLDKQKSCASWADLRSPKGFSVLVRSQPNPNGHFGFTRRDGNHGGTIIDLLQQEGWSWHQILELANQSTPTQLGAPLSSPLQKRQTEKTPKPPATPSLSLFTPFHNTPPRSYLEKRGISRKTLSLFRQGSLTYSALFPLFLLVQDKLRLHSAIRYSEDPNNPKRNLKRFLGPREGNFNLLAPFHLRELLAQLPLDSLYLFECPVDALSFFELAQRKSTPIPDGRWLFLSLCGNPGTLFSKAFPSLLQLLKPKNLIYAFDNDQAGAHYASHFATIAKGTLLFPQEKDWNALLKKQVV